MSKDTKKTFSGNASWKVPQTGGRPSVERVETVRATVELKDGELRYNIQVGSDSTTSNTRTDRDTLPSNYHIKARIRELAAGAIKQRRPYGAATGINVNI